MSDVVQHIPGVAQRYAQALLDLAQQDGVVDQVQSQLQRFSELLGSVDALRQFVASPVYTSAQHLDVLDKILESNGISGLAARFLKVIAANRRLNLVAGILRGFDALVLRNKGEITAQVSVAEPLDASKTRAVTQALSEMTGRDVKIDLRVDPSLIGGLLVQIGSRRLDASVKTKLNSLRTQMKEVR